MRPRNRRHERQLLPEYRKAHLDKCYPSTSEENRSLLPFPEVYTAWQEWGHNVQRQKRRHLPGAAFLYLVEALVSLAPVVFIALTATNEGRQRKIPKFNDFRIIALIS